MKFKLKGAQGVLTLAVLAASAPLFHAAAQDAAAAAKAAPGRVVGVVTSIQGSTVTIKTDAGAEAVISVADTTRMLQTVPGQKDLSGATPIHLTDLQVGDRVLARATLADDGKTYAASTLIAMKQADLNQKHEQDRAAWQRSGEGGLVKSVDPAAQTVTISVSGAGTPRTVLIHATPSTITRRYAPDSIEFDDAKPAPLDRVRPGDQLRARGTRSADGSELQADEIVSGTFRNVVATVISVDAGADTITARDLVAKSPVVIQIKQDSQLRKLPPMMAQMLAARLKGANGAPGSGVNGQPGSRGGYGNGNSGSYNTATNSPANRMASDGSSAGSGPPAAGPNTGVPDSAADGSGTWQNRSGGATPGAAGQGTGEQHPRADLQQALSRAPLIKISDLQKGDAIMVVTTEGSPSAPPTAVTLLAGVEPMLQASASGSQSMLSSSWNLGGGAGGEGEGGAATP